MHVRNKMIVICSTGLSQEEKELAKSRTEELQWKWDDDLHDGVTHLLASTVGSAKYKAAVAWNLQIVKPEWLEECIAKREKVDEEQFQLQILYGLCLCTTGLHVEQREIVQSLARKAGAYYQPDLEVGYTTHLIAKVLS